MSPSPPEGAVMRWRENERKGKKGGDPPPSGESLYVHSTDRKNRCQNLIRHLHFTYWPGGWMSAKQAPAKTPRWGAGGLCSLFGCASCSLGADRTSPNVS